MNKKTSIPYILTVYISIILLIVVIRPLFVPYLTGAADGFAHKFRLVNFHQSLSEGTIRPRWIGNAVLGYGAPLFLFNYSVPYYIVDGIYRLGFSIQTSSQIYSALTILLSFLSMYVLAKFLWGRWAGLIAGFAYTFTPYHLLTIYSYEAWGEMLAFVFPPILLYLLLYALRYSQFSNTKGRVVFGLTVIIWVLFILTHNISSYITSPVLVFITFMTNRKKAITVRYVSVIMVFVLTISAFFTIPAIFQIHTIKIPALLEKEIILRSQYMISILEQIKISWSVLWNNRITYREFTIGIPLILVTVMGIISLGHQCQSWLTRKRTIPPVFLGLLCMTVVSLVLTDPISWGAYTFRPLQFVLYPYRFLFLATFTGSLLSGYLLKKNALAGILFITITVIAGYPFAHPYMDIFPFSRSYFSQPQTLGFAVPTLKTMGIAEFLPKTADIHFLVDEEQKFLTRGTVPEKFILPSGQGEIQNTTIRQESLSAIIYALQPTTLTVSTFWYPNWIAAIDGKSVPISPDQYGRITLLVPAGTHEAQLKFSYSLIEKVAGVISILGVLLFLWSLKQPSQKYSSLSAHAPIS